jgi:hypothetical protein
MAWSMDDWRYLERQVVTDPKGRKWSVALMDVLGQAGDPDVPNSLVELQHASGRYIALVYSPSGMLQREQSHQTLAEATKTYERLLVGVFDGTIDPTQPVFRQDLED